MLGQRGSRYLLGLGDTEAKRIHENEAYPEHSREVADFRTRPEAELLARVSLRDEGQPFSMGRSVASCSRTVPVNYRGERPDVGVVPDLVFRGPHAKQCHEKANIRQVQKGKGAGGNLGGPTSHPPSFVRLDRS